MVEEVQGQDVVLIIFGSYRSVPLGWSPGDHHVVGCSNLVDPLISCLSRRKSGDKAGPEM